MASSSPAAATALLSIEVRRAPRSIESVFVERGWALERGATGASVTASGIELWWEGQSSCEDAAELLPRRWAGAASDACGEGRAAEVPPGVGWTGRGDSRVEAVRLAQDARAPSFFLRCDGAGWGEDEARPADLLEGANAAVWAAAAPHRATFWAGGRAAVELRPGPSPERLEAALEEAANAGVRVVPALARRARPLAVLRRRLVGAGFHRMLVTRMALGAAEVRAGCSVACVLDALPAGLYPDAFELAEAARFDEGAPAVLVSHGVDLEAPREAPAARQTLAAAFPAAAAVAGGGGTLSWPVHLRYHGPLEGPDPGVALPAPRVFVTCPGGGPPLLAATTVLGEPPSASVPVGVAADAPWVAAGTLAVTVSAAAALVAALFRQRKKEKRK